MNLAVLAISVLVFGVALLGAATFVSTMLGVFNTATLATMSEQNDDTEGKKYVIERYIYSASLYVLLIEF